MLTDTKIRNAKPGEKPYKLYDDRGPVSAAESDRDAVVAAEIDPSCARASRAPDGVDVVWLKST
jgi:hypothetical protein